MDTAATEPTLVEVDEVTTAVIRGVVAMTEMAAFFDSTFTRLPAVLAGQGVAITGPAFAPTTLAACGGSPPYAGIWRTGWTPSTT